jgi:diguanylate cyclase (GGDEF)-like protein
MKSKTKILIVDDEPAILNFMMVGLRSRGHEILTATTAEDGVDIALNSKPDLVLMDVVLPGLGGMEACRLIKQKAGGFIPVILVTVKNDVLSKVQGADHGADDFLTKPFVLEELYTKVRAMLRIKALYDELERASITDALTGCYNRRFFQTRMKEEYERSRRSGRPLTCLMFDIDFFKKINDAHGHPVGDAVLKTFTDLVRSQIRQTDMLFRYGGEEFVVVLPETAVAEGRRLAETLRSTIQAHAIKHNGLSLAITCSVGVCGVPAPAIRDYEHLVKCLDDGLYQAKKEGRNRVIVYGSDQPDGRLLIGNG